ncbi:MULTISPECIES: phosphocholine-specific phospholipase C [Streptomyces]|uniref:phospholipase C n=1 Tax=Streptomyces venezuelae (strain ATCC 10712 / CBS 650.69 / DSM 40230 / JCM 4526 / NBRC 13096 / PD 04745) TaxID=953739 RepID=F2R112_STRVP|nr:phospholipase C, phosphocholine-specific [Streptomyces venezuelae]APE21494.1 phospholipase C, phosphocholine-specific [Streptomyces venezuelae]QER98881.1 phospholipase C, phosphocholine-specific [Streptomyces venezuelae ATCC 10712]CCA55529.1 Phospholipase C [Streptomyces venezuelae ATCC 10712]
MADLDRRRFLQLAGGAAAFTMLSESVARAAAIPAQGSTGTIQDIEHIVVLMQENRSFDHYFGAMKGVRGFGDPRPVTLPSGKSVWNQSDGSKVTLPFRPTSDKLGMEYLQGLNHDWAGGQSAFNKGKYDNWVPAKTKATMAHLTREDIPFHYALADAFTICDAYHCSFIGATDPNRYYMWTGYVGNDGKGGGPVLNNAEAGYGWTTYPERLEAAGVSWKIYQDIGDGLNAAGSWGWINDAFRGNYGDNSLLYFNNYRNAQPGNPLYDKARTGTNAKAGEGFFDILRADVQGGRLPKVSWIAAPEAFSEHANWPSNYGAWYIAQVLDALTSNPDVWARTALFITYDENDGFFDHVVPPYAPGSAAQGLSTAPTALDYFGGKTGYVAGPYGLGPRVPMIVVSPWSTGGYTCSETFDHTSVIRFMEQRFGVTEPQISPWRRAVCGDLTSAFDFSRTDTSAAPLPPVAGYYPPDKNRHPDFLATAPASGTMPRQERGAKPTRPLKYAPYVDGAADIAAGKFRLTFSGGPAAGAQFYVTSANRTDAPWTYTAEAAKSISDTWNTTYSKGVTDLTVHGPNGFVRRFRSPGKTAVPEVTARHNATTGQLDLTFTNAGTTATVTLTNAYGGTPATLTVAKGATVTRAVDVSAAHRWYDITVTSSASTDYVRRLAGHVETGAPSQSDPAILTY